MNFEIAPKSTEVQLNWDDARLYCFSLNIDGKIGWRLPTKEELNRMYESQNDFEKSWYWSSTEFNINYAWDQMVANGYLGDHPKTHVNYVRAIRSI